MEKLAAPLSKVLDEQIKFLPALSVYKRVDYLPGDYF